MWTPKSTEVKLSEDLAGTKENVFCLGGFNFAIS
jgi:hypothetical protein